MNHKFRVLPYGHTAPLFVLAAKMAVHRYTVCHTHTDAIHLEGSFSSLFPYFISTSIKLYILYILYIYIIYNTYFIYIIYYIIYIYIIYIIHIIFNIKFMSTIYKLRMLNYVLETRKPLKDSSYSTLPWNDVIALLHSLTEPMDPW